MFFREKDNCKLVNMVITEEMVLDKLQNIEKSKAAGPDDVSPDYLKEMAQQIAKPLQRIFTTSLETAKIPVECKNSSITPLYKKGDRSQVSNYRPVNLTSVTWKIMEMLLRDTTVYSGAFRKAFTNTRHTTWI